MDIENKDKFNFHYAVNKFEWIYRTFLSILIDAGNTLSLLSKILLIVAIIGVTIPNDDNCWLFALNSAINLIISEF
jgi:hypothetical protein